MAKELLIPHIRNVVKSILTAIALIMLQERTLRILVILAVMNGGLVTDTDTTTVIIVVRVRWLAKEVAFTVVVTVVTVIGITMTL